MAAPAYAHVAEPERAGAGAGAAASAATASDAEAPALAAPDPAGCPRKVLLCRVLLVTGAALGLGSAGRAAAAAKTSLLPSTGGSPRGAGAPLWGRGAQERAGLTQLYYLGGNPFEQSVRAAGLEECLNLTSPHGIPRRVIYFSETQAWICSDTNGDGRLTYDELGPAATAPRSVVLGTKGFYDHVRYVQDVALEKGTHFEGEVIRWARQLLKHMPPTLVDLIMEYIGDPGKSLPELFSNTLGGSNTESHGVVDAVYTYGAPSLTAAGQLVNHARADGCFPGMRTYTRGSAPVPYLGFLMNRADPMSFLLTLFGFRHAKTNVLVVDDDNLMDSKISSCGEGKPLGWLGPLPDGFFSFSIHRPGYYQWSLDMLVAAVLRLEGETKVDHKLKELFSCANRFAYNVGDTVSIPSDESTVKDALARTGLDLTPEVQGLLGKDVQVQSVPSPNLLGCLTNRSSSQVYLPTDIVQLKHPEEEQRRRLEQGKKMEEAVPRRLLSENGELIRGANKFAPLAFAAYDKLPEVKADLTVTDDLGYRVVGRARANFTTVTLLQDESNACVLSFGVRDPREQDIYQIPVQFRSELDEEPGVSHNLYYWQVYLAGYGGLLDQRKTSNQNDKRDFVLPYYGAMRNTGMNEAGFNRTWDEITKVEEVMDLCGFPGVQAEHVRMYEDLVASPDWMGKVKSSLPKCASVTAVGHDLGGAMATLWAACANSGAGNLDGHASRSSWEKESPSRIDEWADDRLAAARPDIDASAQKWSLGNDGSLKNAATDKCLIVAGQSDAAIGANAVLKSCSPTGRIENLQPSWVFGSTDGKKGLLVSKDLGLCLTADSTVQRCLLTDQVWAFTDNGFIVNRRSGLCVGFESSESLSRVLLQRCEYEKPNSSQIFERTSEGVLRSKALDKCLDATNLEDDGQMRVVSWECSDAESQVFKMWTPEIAGDLKAGFLFNKFNTKCLDVEGNNPEEGKIIGLWRCEYGSFATAPKGQGPMWQLSSEGHIYSRGTYPDYKSGCLTVDTDSLTVSLQDCV